MKITKEEVMQAMLNLTKEVLMARKPVKMPHFPKSTHDEEIMCLMLSDCQIGLKTPTFNLGVFQERMAKYIHHFGIILQKERRSIPIRKCVVFMLGDILHSDIVGRFMTLEEFEVVVIKQWEKHALPNFEMLFVELLKKFESVEVYCVAGNHGNYQKISEADNWDSILYKTLQLLFRNEPRIHFEIAEGFNLMAKVMGWKFHLAHGDQMNCYNGIPYFAMVRKALNWSNSLGGFDYQLYGHFHHCFFFTVSKLGIIGNGSFISDDPYTMKRLGVNPPPRQWMFAVHPKYGITGRWEIQLEK